MAVSSLLALLFFVHVTGAQYLACRNGGQGPCLPNRICAPGALCIPTIVGDVCCELAQIVLPGVPTTTTAAPVLPPVVTVLPATCVDKVNPRTGVSDCPRLAYLCNNAVYYTLMTEQCPRTCNRCTGVGVAPAPGVVVGTTCQDLVDYRTGVSNCAQMAGYCRNPIYATLMRQQCPRTCGYCV
ncbi:hypothetical protein RB195_016006 [Necator americanus]|uniref:ShKT domain-containing protein n=1 Tax=Necator americanus TaxID=51031 RepID=A0ABR1E756_NECAM